MCPRMSPHSQLHSNTILVHPAGRCPGVYSGSGAGAQSRECHGRGLMAACAAISSVRSTRLVVLVVYF